MFLSTQPLGKSAADRPLQVTVEGKRRRGRPRKSWIDNITEWTIKSFAETQAMAHNQQDAGQQLMKKHVCVGATKVYATNVIYLWIEILNVKLKRQLQAEISNRHRIRTTGSTLMDQACFGYPLANKSKIPGLC